MGISYHLVPGLGLDLFCTDMILLTSCLLLTSERKVARNSSGILTSYLTGGRSCVCHVGTGISNTSRHTRVSKQAYTSTGSSENTCGSRGQSILRVAPLTHTENRTSVVKAPPHEAVDQRLEALCGLPGTTHPWTTNLREQGSV